MASWSKAFTIASPTADQWNDLTPVDGAAATYTVPQNGNIKKIRVSFYQGAVDKACSGILRLTADRGYLKGNPQEFAIGGITGTSGTDTGIAIPTETIDVDIPIEQGTIMKVSIYPNEAIEDVVVSLTVVS